MQIKQFSGMRAENRPLGAFPCPLEMADAEPGVAPEGSEHATVWKRYPPLKCWDSYLIFTAETVPQQHVTTCRSFTIGMTVDAVGISSTSLLRVLWHERAGFVDQTGQQGKWAGQTRWTSRGVGVYENSLVFALYFGILSTLSTADCGETPQPRAGKPRGLCSLFLKDAPGRQAGYRPVVRRYFRTGIFLCEL